MKTKLHVFGILTVLGVCTIAQAQDRFVTPGGSGGGSSWADPMSLQSAVVGVPASATVWVTNGTYLLTGQLTIGNFKIKSYKNGALDRAGTIINGNYPSFTNRCFTLNNAGALVEGFTITNGYITSGNGGGVTISAGTLRNCLVTGNNLKGGGAGAGVYATGSSSLITNCDINANTANAGYGAGAAMASSAQLLDSRIKFNQGLTSSSGGGGVHLASSAVLRNCEIISNLLDNVSSTQGGGVYVANGTTVRNCLIVGNRANHGGGVGCVGNGGVIENCTILGNTGYAGNGIDTTTHSQTVHIRNTICSQPVQSYGNNATFYITNSCLLTTNLSTISAGKAYGSGNIAGEPAFLWRAGGDYRLTPWSRGVDAGYTLDWMGTATDLAGQNRISANNKPDMGAYETTAGPVRNYYVARRGQTPVSPYTNSWKAAASNIQDVLNVMSDGGTVLVTNGVYALANELVVNYATLRSYNKGALDPTNTIINGNNYAGKPVTNRCITMNYADAVVDGFTITNGYIIGNGGGVYMTGGTLRNCVVTRNTSTNATGGSGGGVYATGADSLITNCTIRFNRGLGSTSLGAGVCLVSGASLCNSHIVSNSLRQILTTRGAGVCMADASTTLRNCLIVGNSGGYYGSGVGGVSGMTVDNCTINDNSGYLFLGIGTAGVAQNVHIRNTICRDTVGAYSDVGTFYLTNSCLVSTNWTTKASGSGNITNDPQFVNLTAGDYRLMKTSPCIDKGVLLPWMTAGAVDLDGGLRLDRFSGIVDMGCYEYVPPRRGTSIMVR